MLPKTFVNDNHYLKEISAFVYYGSIVNNVPSIIAI